MTISSLLRILAETQMNDSGRDDLTNLHEEAQKAWRRADRRIERARAGAQEAMGVLERIRINVMAVQMDEFLKEFESLRNVDLSDCADVIPLPAEPLDLKKLHTLVDMYDRIRDAGTLGYSASTESTFYFGPGLLTLYARTPEFHFTQETISDGSKESLEMVARDLQNFGAKVTEICSHLQSIRHAAEKAASVMYDLGDFLDDGMKDIQMLKSTRGNNWKNFSRNDKLFVARGVQIAILVQDMADSHVLTEDGHIKESLKTATKHARDVIHLLGA